MALREYILNEKNIYLAIYAVNSYVFDPQLLDKKDKELLGMLADPFNEEIINETIRKVKEVLVNILDDEDYLFESQVYYKPKDYCESVAVYRPIHTAKLEQLIAMVALLHPFIYEIPDEENNWKLSLSNYSRLIPNNFYGNRVSKRPEELFKKWNNQYKLYTQKANECFKTFNETNEYRYELKLDLENFFPSVDPLVIYGILMESIPVTLIVEKDIEDFKNIIYKLLVCKVVNLNTNMAIENYYGISSVERHYTKGIAQGLPQSYFFGNICMIKISEIFEKRYSGRAVYYVDDSYIYTNVDIEDNLQLKKQLKEVNAEIAEMTTKYKKEDNKDDTLFKQRNYLEFNACLAVNKENSYSINVHTEGKSTYTKIQDIQDGEIYLRTLSREASQIGTDIMSTYSEEEEETMLNRTKALLKSIEAERKTNLENRKGYEEKLERYYKFFKYREIKLRLRTEKNINKNVFETLVGEISEEEFDADNKTYGYSFLNRQITEKFFFENYKHDIWQVAISVLIRNTGDEQNQVLIKQYISRVIKMAYPDELMECSYIVKMYADYLENIDVQDNQDCYFTLNQKINKKLIHFANLNSKVMKNEFECVRLKGIEHNILISFGICTSNFVDMCKIVSCNSNRLHRMFLNAVYSKVFKVALSEDVVISSYDKKGITYGELRVLVFLRNTNCDILKFLKWDMQLMSGDNLQNVDYAIFEVLGAYKKYVNDPENIDKLILIHKYTCDVWKNGAKHLYFYTLHNQEHAVDLVKNIIKIVKTFSYLKITNYDYFILFMACYLHDISMVRIASKNEFILDVEDSTKIVTELDEKWNKCHSTADTKNVIYDTYKLVDSYFEIKIRSRHALESAKEIRDRTDLCFLEPSVRESVAEIAESHMMDAKDIYYLKGDAKNKLISYKFDKILLRFADLLDMSERRVSKPILNHNIDNMSAISAFHWVSHLLTEGYELTSQYICNEDILENNLSPGRITEEVTLTIFVKLSQFSKFEANTCRCGKINEESICSKGFEIELINDDNKCISSKCNFLCKWFNEKNNYLIEEMQALEAYLLRVPLKERFYNTKILIKVVVSNPTDILDEQFEILKQKINSK